MGWYEPIYNYLIPCAVLAILNILFAAAIASWMINEVNSSRWKNKILDFQNITLAKLFILDRSWNAKPFVEMAAIYDAQTCPLSMPDEVVFQTWLGTTLMCDCLNMEMNREYRFHKPCQDQNQQGRVKESDPWDCKTTRALSPIIQNKINQVIYCGKRGELSLSEMVRPVLTDDTYACPAGTKPCNEDFFDNDGIDYVVCIPDDADINETCPITSIALDLDQVDDRSLYEPKGGSGDESIGFYASRKVMQHGIEQVHVTPRRPCLDSREYNADTM